MTQRACVAIVIVSCVLGVARAADAQDTIEALVATALERSPELRAARATVAAAGGQVTQANLRPNPIVTGSQTQISGGQHQTVIGVEWPLDLFRRPARLAVA